MKDIWMFLFYSCDFFFVGLKFLKWEKRNPHREFAAPKNMSNSPQI